MAAPGSKTGKVMESVRHMLEGISRMEHGEWLAALCHFDRAVELRETLHWRGNVESAWLLAAAWINRSDVLRQLEETAEAIRSLERAIEAMSYVPLADNPGYVSRLVLAWINHATACGEAHRFDESLASFARAHGLLDMWGGAVSPERKLLASMLEVNRARVLLELGRPIQAWREARMGVERLRDLEQVEPVKAAAIKARGVLCRALATLLDEPGGTDLAEDWIARATDAAEEALALVRASSYRGAWVADLLRYGARIYRICQPHFLGEYLCEWLAADGLLSGNETLKQEMCHELMLARYDLELRVRQSPHLTDRVEREMATLLSLQVAETALAGKAVPQA